MKTLFRAAGVAALVTASVASGITAADFRGNSLIFRGGGGSNDLRGIQMYPGWNWDDEISSVWG